MEEKDINNNLNSEDVIDLIEIVKKLWKNRKFIIKVTVTFAILGFLVAISTPNVYTASSTMVPQSSQKNAGGNLGGLAAMAGINLGGLYSGDVLSPSVYPKIMSNINFQKEFIYSKFHFKGVKQPITLYEYYTNKKYKEFSLIGTIKKYTIGLPGVIIDVIKGENKDFIQSDSSSIQSLTYKEKYVIEIINANLSLDVNNKDGFVSISSNMSEPVLATEMVLKGQELLQKYLTSFKIEKVTNNLSFVEKSYEEAKKNFEIKQIELARFRDSNKNLNSSIAKTQEEKLLSEYALLLNIYTELAKQKEQAKIAVTETTPILTIIEPAYIPNEKSQPNRIGILIISVFIGLALSIGIILIIRYLEDNFSLDVKNAWFIPKID